MMPPTASAPPVSATATPEPLSAIVRRLRRQAGLTLQELGRRSKLSSSALSKIENDQMSPTYDTIQRLADGLGIDVAELFIGRAGNRTGSRMTVTRRGQGVRQRTSQYTYEMLCADIARKQLVPLLTTIHARSTAEFPALVTHAGEEFVFVLTGTVTVMTEHYAPLTLESGDSCYFDSTMGHALISAGEEAATVLWVCSRVVPPLTA
ncbi:MAG: helix-turn-helix domain-containing protein [Devosia sp.]